MSANQHPSIHLIQINQLFIEVKAFCFTLLISHETRWWEVNWFDLKEIDQIYSTQDFLPVLRHQTRQWVQFTNSFQLKEAEEVQEVSIIVKKEE